ncbi:hypothetical protein CP975_02670 [Streptomyces alboniger]|uniref:Transposase n=1 Tax=Streptomyces alboniger TaxID=132473 RepID=A0A5J6HB55_STRAD|nr:hypothetical protein CP975_02670 [Streptomyces alboniger]
MQVAPLPPPAPERLKPFRAALGSIMYASRTGLPWRDVRAETVGRSGVTAWRRLQGRTYASTVYESHSKRSVRPASSQMARMAMRHNGGSSGSCRRTCGTIRCADTPHSGTEAEGAEGPSAPSTGSPVSETGDPPHH